MRVALRDARKNEAEEESSCSSADSYLPASQGPSISKGQVSVHNATKNYSLLLKEHQLAHDEFQFVLEAEGSERITRRFISTQEETAQISKA
jgi:hypothetical protein